MKVVLDTNVLIAAFIAHGQCGELLEHCAVNHRIVLSKPILDEFRRILVRKFEYTRTEAGASARLLRSRAEWVKPTALPQPVCRDPDDDAILATAIAGKARVIVTGDKDLTDLVTFRGMKILSPADFWRFENNIGDADVAGDA